MFPAYGAQIVHMPFGSVYTSLQTGVVDMAENGVNVYDSNKHYEVAPIMSLTGHEANCNLLWCSDKAWQSFTPEQQGWVQAAATEVNTKVPMQAIELEHKSQAKLEKIGVKFVTDVDKSGFIKTAEPLQDKIAADLGSARDEDPAGLPLGHLTHGSTLRRRVDRPADGSPPEVARLRRGSSAC